MKTTQSMVSAALVGAAAAQSEGSFTVLRFNGMLTAGRMDPIVSPGEPSQHVHGILGGSGFRMDGDVDALMNSECTSATVEGDNSAYWFPTLYFQDPESEELEPVPFYYASVYYFFDATDDETKAFPPGLQIVAGNANTRVLPEGGAELNLDPSKGTIQNIQWTCPRLDQIYEPPSWTPDSDGSGSGVGAGDQEKGQGFPDRSCDGMYSPLRADVHMPSCYNPEAGLDNWMENMAFPEDNGQGKLNCPEGWMHVPHLFFEAYWDTPQFDGRWEQGSGKQPFVLSNGDVTGYSSHADFFSGWDEEVLQNIIDNCNTGTNSMHTCPGVTHIEGECTIPSEVDEQIDGTMSELPGDNPLKGWHYGTDSAKAKSKASSKTSAKQASKESSWPVSEQSPWKKPANLKFLESASEFSAKRDHAYRRHILSHKRHGHQN